MKLELQAEARREGQFLRFTFILSGDVEELNIPAFIRPLRSDKTSFGKRLASSLVRRPETRVTGN